MPGSKLHAVPEIMRLERFALMGAHERRRHHSQKDQTFHSQPPSIKFGMACATMTMLKRALITAPEIARRRSKIALCPGQQAAGHGQA